MSTKSYSSLGNFKRLNINHSIPLENFTTLRIGGKAEWFAEPKRIEDLKALIQWKIQENIECQIIGAGSNLLINDSPIKGLTICLKKLQGSFCNAKTGKIEALSGEALPLLSRKAAKAGLHGLEWAVGIPGTVGGAVVMNAGAQGSCIADVLESVQVLCLKSGKDYEIKNSELNFDYRYSELQKEKLLVISAKFLLEEGHNYREILSTTIQNLRKRTKTQPYHLPSCGSVFRNPEPLKAGKIIEDLGLKGIQIGGAEVSNMHGNFIVNRNNATAKDVDRIIQLIQKKVKEVYGLDLYPEVKRIGFAQKN